MKRRIKSFSLFKESYLHEFEDDTLLPDELEDTNTEETSNDAEFASLEDGSEEGSEEAPIADGDGEEGESNSELKDKICGILDSNYAENLKDIINGVINELGEEEDKDSIMDTLVDCIEDRVQSILMGDEDSEDEGSEDSEDEGSEDSEDEGEDLNLDEEDAE